MARNLEIKVACANLELARDRALAAGARPHAVEQQTDRYYQVDGARRVKLRSFGGGRAELIEYNRLEVEGVRVSRYRVTPVRSEDGVCAVPSGAPLVTVKKRREILLLDNVRIHLDTVDDLGTYIELEAVADEDHSEARCRARVSQLMEILGVEPSELVRASYSDLLLARSGSGTPG